MKIESSNTNVLASDLEMAKEVVRMCLEGDLTTTEALELIREKYGVE